MAEKRGIEGFTKDWTLLSCLSRIERYRAECESFQIKYGMTMEEFEFLLHQERGHEDFEKEDDLADWQFSSEALKWWEERTKNLQESWKEQL